MEKDIWENSPFNWIRKSTSGTKGKIGENIVREWAVANGYEVSDPTSTEHDLIIEGMKIEIKMSTLWASGNYVFQQIRDQDYDYIFCLGISPQEVHSWLISKETAHERIIGHLPQHKGKGGTDTFWLNFKADSPPEWLETGF